ncbi:hypothetical protein PENSUB_2125 [Penicillium subrubescens]|uniref:Uncharacterized protein n=1 Tax=Penicillium subrubescens TaxID=1316194 RepID=A0A1Q5UIX9_9EURO|nr:hypothetical protein PENSUB_2125 [Penicillium subrubescens]
MRPHLLQVLSKAPAPGNRHVELYPRPINAHRKYVAGQSVKVHLSRSISERCQQHNKHSDVEGTTRRGCDRSCSMWSITSVDPLAMQVPTGGLSIRADKWLV